MSLMRAANCVKREWPTLLLLFACYLIWFASIFSYQHLGWIVLLPAMLTVTLHSSLQHEILHGHPSHNAAFNELLVYPAVGLFIPFRRFRDLHLAHHIDHHLTDPLDDPESWYLNHAQWTQCSKLLQTLLKHNATLSGRMLIGPGLSLVGFWRADLRSVFAGRKAVAIAWLHHSIGLALVVTVLNMASMPILVYCLLVAYPAMSILMIRTFIEHKACENISERTAVVEAGSFFSLLFLNNNLHAVHHRFPQASWFNLPSLWQSTRKTVLEKNAAYHYPHGYWSIIKKYLLKAREPVVHPLLKKNQDKLSNLDVS